MAPLVRIPDGRPECAECRAQVTIYLDGPEEKKRNLDPGLDVCSICGHIICSVCLGDHYAETHDPESSSGRRRDQIQRAISDQAAALAQTAFLSAVVRERHKLELPVFREEIDAINKQIHQCQKELDEIADIEAEAVRDLGEGVRQ